MSSSPRVAIMMGSKSDLPVMQLTQDTLLELGIGSELRILSAHRTPQAVHDYVTGAPDRGIQVFVCAAGMAAHLAGAVAAMTVMPVIGVPLDATMLGLDALLSTVQMPPGIPVATTAIGKPGAKNAAYLAASILAVGDAAVRTRLVAARAAMASAVLESDRELQHRKA